MVYNVYMDSFTERLHMTINQTEHKIIPSVFTEAVYLIEGKPFSFEGREYLKTIYDTDIAFGLMKTGRQVEKSTTLSIKMANDVLLTPFNRSLYVAPQNEQVKTFSKERLAKLLRYSKENIVRRFFMNTSLSDQVFMREYTNGSTIWLRHCFDRGDNIRGLSIDNLYIDECQDINTDALPVIQETQFASSRPVTWLTGTPKTLSNTIEAKWNISTKNEWVVKCSHCNTQQIIGMKNITPKFLACRKCGCEITTADIGRGVWIETQPGKDLKGFHISQMMSPRAKMTSRDGKGIYQKMQTYSMAKFYNEVLGLSYEYADKLVSDTDLDALMANDFCLYDRAPDHLAQSKIYMGVDWGTGGKSYTVATIFYLTDENKLRMIYCKRYETGNELDQEKQLEHICQLMDLFHVDLGVVDWGFGYAQAQKLRQRFGLRIAVNYYTHQQRDKVVYADDKQFYKTRRTDIMMDYVTQMIHKRKAEWAGADYAKLGFMRDHHLAEQAEYRTSNNGRSEELFLTHPQDYPDDGLHSCVYAYMAYLLSVGGLDVVRNVNRSYHEDIEFYMAEGG